MSVPLVHTIFYSDGTSYSRREVVTEIFAEENPSRFQTVLLHSSSGREKLAETVDRAVALKQHYAAVQRCFWPPVGKATKMATIKAFLQGGWRRGR